MITETIREDMEATEMMLHSNDVAPFEAAGQYSPVGPIVQVLNEGS